MATVTIKSEVKPTHRPIPAEPIEAWYCGGQPFEMWPDWIRSHYNFSGPPEGRKGKWALRDDEGYFWRWMANDQFIMRYEPLSA